MSLVERSQKPSRSRPWAIPEDCEPENPTVSNVKERGLSFE
jgi:hypothetical protein